jgi:membrane protease YdiL (CAAX protease family)
VAWAGGPTRGSWRASRVDRRLEAMGALGRTTLHGCKALGAMKKARDLLVQYFDRAVLALLAARRRRGNGSPLVFFLLVLALSLPFWLLGAVTEARLLPGLPVSALMFVCPAAAAAILVYGANGTAGVKALLWRAFDHGRIGKKMWYAPILLLMPGVTVLAYGLMRLMGSPLPPLEFPLLALPAMLLAFFVAALGEELGWSGTATDPLQERWGALGAGVLLGSVSAAWHVVPLVQADRSQAWIAWWCLYTVGEGFSSSGSTTTRQRACSPRPCSTPPATPRGSCSRISARTGTRASSPLSSWS